MTKSTSRMFFCIMLNMHQQTFKLRYYWKKVSQFHDSSPNGADYIDISNF